MIEKLEFCHGAVLVRLLAASKGLAPTGVTQVLTPSTGTTPHQVGIPGQGERDSGRNVKTIPG